MISIRDIDYRKTPMFMRTHRTKCRCLKRFGVCLFAIGLIPILIVYFMVSDQIFYRIKRTDVSISYCDTLLLFLSSIKSSIHVRI